MQTKARTLIRPSIPLAPVMVAPPMRDKIAGAGVANALRSITREACEMLGITHDELTGKTRHERVTLARRLIVVVAKTYTTASYPSITRVDRPACKLHTTSLTAHKAFNKRGHAEEVWWMGSTLTGAQWLEKLEGRLRLETTRKPTDNPC
jgi:hypothetical protein